MTSQWRRRFWSAASIAIGLQFALAIDAPAATTAWTQIGAGPFSWNSGANWNPAVVPNGMSEIVNFTTAGGPATQSVTLDAAITLGVIDLTNAATSYTISNGAGGSFTFDNGASASTINMSSGLAQTISADAGIGALGLTLTNSSANALTLSGVLSGAGSLAKLGTGNVVLSGTNLYGGATTVSNGTLTVGGASGSINSSSAYTLTGGPLSSGRLVLDNTAGNVERLNDALPVALSMGSELSLVFNAAADTTETIGSLNIGPGNSTVTVSSTAGRVDRIAASGISRSSNATALVRGSTLGGQATNVGQVTLGSLSGLTQVGTTTSSSGSNGGSDTTLTIVPFLFGDTAVAGTGNNFVTYDTVSGIRALGSGEYATLTAGYVTPANHENVKAAAVTLTDPAVAVNSLLYTGATALAGTATTLTVDSGAVASTTGASTIPNSFSGLVLGNGEGVMTVGAGSFTVAAPISITGTGSGNLIKAGGGSLIYSSDSTVNYAGGTVINQGILQVGTATAGSMGANTANITLAGGVLQFGRTDAVLSVANVIDGTGSVVQSGSGTTTLTGASTYTGGTYISAGKLALSGGNNRLPTGTVVNFHPINYTIGTNYTTALDIGSTSQTISTIHLPGAGVIGVGPVVSTENPTGAQVTISGTGGTLTLNGDHFYVGVAVATLGTNPGALAHNVNMTNLSNFVFDNPNKEIGVHNSGGRVNAATSLVGTLTLAPNSTIRASNLLVGDRGPNGIAGGGRSVLNFGNGTTVLNIGSSAAQGVINVGYSLRSNADLVLPAGGNLTIRGFGGGSAPLPEFLVGLIANSNSLTAFTDTVNLSQGTVNAIVTKLDVGTADNAAGGRAGVNTSSFTLGATSGAEGFTVDTLRIGRMIGTGANIVNNFSQTATFTLNNANGVLNANTISLAENTITDANAGGFTKTLNATLALTAGTIKATNIQLGPQGGTATTLNRVLNWTAGTIENTAGSDLAINSVPITLLTAGARDFNATGTNSIIQNSGSPITGATFGINKIGAGALILNATNTYTGPTTVTQGTLGGNGTLASIVSLLGGSTISPGTSPGTLTVGGLTISDNSSSIFELNAADTTVGGGINDLIDINGLFDVAGANAATVTVNVLKIGGGNFDGLGTWTLMTYDSLNPGLFNPASVVITGIDPGYTASLLVVPDTVNPLAAGKVQLNVVPEASSVVLMGLGLIGFAGFLRNRRSPGNR